jgi:NADPH:quinone reductase-like Zn-dependent oxidoreductase
MRAWQLEESFGLGQLRLAERDAPRPGRGEVLVRLEAMSLNARDRMMIDGTYNPRQPLPLIPCSDGAGIVEEVGAEVEDVIPGDRVCTLFAPYWLDGEPVHETVRATLGGPLDGTLCERIVLPAGGVIRYPEHLGPVEAATLPCAALTAWSALVTQAEIGDGATVLVLGTGGVSIFALQIARLRGAQVVVTSSSDAKLERVRELGAWETVNYASEPKWGNKVRELTGGRGVDHVVEVGGAATFGESIRACRLGATISSIGVIGGHDQGVPLVPIFMRQLRVQGILVGHRRSFEEMNSAITRHRLRPVVDRVFAFEEVPEAFRYLAEARHLGKVCVQIEPAP